MNSCFLVISCIVCILFLYKFLPTFASVCTFVCTAAVCYALTVEGDLEPAAVAAEQPVEAAAAADDDSADGRSTNPPRSLFQYKSCLFHFCFASVLRCLLSFVNMLKVPYCWRIFALCILSENINRAYMYK